MKAKEINFVELPSFYKDNFEFCFEKPTKQRIRLNFLFPPKFIVVWVSRAVTLNITTYNFSPLLDQE